MVSAELMKKVLRAMSFEVAEPLSTITSRLGMYESSVRPVLNVMAEPDFQLVEKVQIRTPARRNRYRVGWKKTARR